MKWMIASDLHGSYTYTKKLLAAYERENASQLILLGDILYHGPRNDLPKDYNPKKVIELLNSYKTEICCVRGNCDTEVDQMVLEFPILSEYALFSNEKFRVFATHGHHYNMEHPLPMKKGDILIFGHTHIPLCEEKEGNYYMNPGSVSIPKNDSWHGYMIWEGNSFWWKDLEGIIKNNINL
ncbi:MAG: phosphodiesterase [Bacillota bacterium]|nr:phosphodiesterase [Bacillota bacterium]